MVGTNGDSSRHLSINLSSISRISATFIYAQTTKCNTAQVAHRIVGWIGATFRIESLIMVPRITFQLYLWRIAAKLKSQCNTWHPCFLGKK